MPHLSFRTRRLLAGVAIATASITTGTMVAPAAEASAAATARSAPARVEQIPLPWECIWIPWYDFYSWYNGWAGLCFYEGGTMWFDWNGGYGWTH